MPTSRPPRAHLAPTNDKKSNGVPSDFPPISRADFYNTDEVAKIIGVDNRTVRRWRNKKIFAEDLRDHKGVFLYKKERVDQLKSVYHKDWMKGGYAEAPHNNLADKLKRDVDNSAVLQLSNNAEPPKLISASHYFSQLVINDINKNKLYTNRQTGFDNLDQKQIFSPGLYVIGATPAAGKTTFCWQLLDQLAQNGEFCIFCSYEMSRLELFSKSLSRRLFLQDHTSTLTAADLRRGGFSGAFESLLNQICSDKNLKGVNLLELRDESVDDLLRLIRPYCADKDKSPVVCLDYLQIVPSSLDLKFHSDKAKIDDIVRKLKIFQRETNTTFLVISSFNRDNYLKQVSFESFKESGNIEYSADVVWALQLNVVNSIKAGADISQTRKKFDDAKKHQPRQVQLKCLKNRHGQNYDCFFNYFSAHDFFQPADDFNEGSFADAEIPNDTIPFDNLQ